jgi:hypothetical protein
MGQLFERRCADFFLSKASDENGNVSGRREEMPIIDPPTSWQLAWLGDERAKAFALLLSSPAEIWIL